MPDPLLLQEVERFILNHPLPEGRHTLSGKQIVRATKAGVEHRLAFQAASGAAWAPFSWTLCGLSSPRVTDLRYRPDLATPLSADEDDLASLSLWLLAANR